MNGTATCYEEIRNHLETTPIIDCHDHSYQCGPKYADAICMIAGGYFTSDLHSALSDSEMKLIFDTTRSLEERWPTLQKGWSRTCHTGYARVTKLIMKKFYGVEELTLDTLKQMQGNLLKLEDEALFDDILQRANIIVRLEDVIDSPYESNYNEDTTGIQAAMKRDLKLPPRSLPVIRLTDYHYISDFHKVQKIAEAVDKHITSLDEYVDVCRTIFEIYRASGSVAFKDQSAYTRKLDYGNPTKAQAEAVFNEMMKNPRHIVSYPEGSKPLDDYLFHSFMQMAREMDLPVQLHTGHMAGIRNDVSKANAIHLRSVLELHADVRFDLLHANWPYDGDVLFLAKNYPNVTINFCWANIIDPIYCQRLYKQALSCVPHGKIHAYGSDYDGRVERAWAHASITRDNITIGLSELVDIEYINLEEAKQIGHDWLFGNANEFYRLGL